MTNDQDMLFGIFAVQVDYIEPRQLAEACVAWAAQKELSLRQILIGWEWLTDDDARDIDKLIQRRMSKTDLETEDFLTKLVYEESIRSEDCEDAWQRIAETILLERLEVLPNRRDRYTLTKLHGEGGLGRVWLARDTLLNREVALKELKPERRAQSDTVKRFVREAQVTGQLDHPNIVPIHELNWDQQSVFYTMRFMRGRTLREKIKSFHQEQQPQVTHNLQFRELLGAFIAVCNAVDNAHSRGVIHRDLKPDNVVLGSFGEVMVIDWGLAKLVGEEDDDDDVASIEFDDSADGDLTKEGQTLGTLAYMAPEQAKGRRRKVDHRSDIYALGATLYEILCGQPPHRGKDSREVFDKIVKLPTPHVRSISPQAPAALDAVCAKAMAKRRSDRYQSARPLIEDVQRWLADEPVSLHRDSWGVRISRWARRNRTWAQSIAVALLMIAVISCGAAVAVRSAWKAERQAKEDALQHFNESLTTIDTLLTGVSEALRYYPGAQQLRSQLLQRAAAEYERLATMDSSDLKLQREACRAMLRLGDVYRTLGEHAQALAAYEKARDELAKLSEDLRGPEIDVDVATCLQRVGDSHRTLNHTHEALQNLESALDHIRGQKAPISQRLEAKILLSLSLVHDSAGKSEDALRSIEDARQIFRSLMNDSSINKQQSQRDLALAQSMLGDILCDTDEYDRVKFDRGCLELQTAVETYRLLCESDPVNPDYLEGLSFCRIQLAGALRAVGRTGEGLVALEQATEDLTALVRAMPDAPGFRENRAVSYANLGRALHEEGRSGEAQPWLDLALSEFERLINSADPLPRQYQALATACVIQAAVLIDLDKPAADANLQTAERIFAQLIAQDDSRVEYHHGMAFCERMFAHLEWKQGGDDQAIASLQRSIEEYELASSNPLARDELATCWEEMGDIYAAKNQATRQAECYAKAMAIRESLPNLPELDYRLASFLLKLDDRDDLERAVEISAQRRAELPGNQRFASLHGALQYRSGQFDESIATLEAVLNASGDGDPSHLYWLAMAYWDRNQEGDRDAAVMHLDNAVERTAKSAPGRMALKLLEAEALKRIRPPEKEPAAK